MFQQEGSLPVARMERRLTETMIYSVTLQKEPQVFNLFFLEEICSVEPKIHDCNSLLIVILLETRSSRSKNHSFIRSEFEDVSISSVWS